MIKFEKVSLGEYIKSRMPKDDMSKETSDKYVKQYTKEWEDIKLPTRSTSGSAGYDFYMPFDTTIHAPYINVRAGFYGDIMRDWKIFPTGIRFVTDEDDVFLMCAPRSGLGFKNISRLANTIGVIDLDYWQSANEGHIMAKMTADVTVDIPKDKAFMQAIITTFRKTDADNTTAKRDGGFGSTDKENRSV